MIYLAIDPGQAHTGIAISYEGTLSQGLITIHCSNLDQLIHKLETIINNHQPQVIIIGQPPQGHIRNLSQQIYDHLSHIFSNLEIQLYNEDLSSQIAQKTLLQSGAKKISRQTKEHQVAAAAILQSYLDNLLQ